MGDAKECPPFQHERIEKLQKILKKLFKDGFKNSFYTMGNLQDTYENIDQKPTEMQLLYAAEFDDRDRLARILHEHHGKQNVDIDAAKFSLWTPLFMASKQGNSECVKALLEAGALVNGINQDRRAWTPLWVATYAGHDECVRLLLEAGADVEVKHPETPLLIAAREGRVNCLKMLIDAGAPINTAGNKGQTVLHVAVMENKVDCVKLLVQAGADLEARNSEGNTPLLNACLHSEAECVKILLQSGANISAGATSPTIDGYTAMHICASKSKIQCLRLLYEFGASLTSKNKDKMRPRDLAVNKECRDYLLQMEGNVRTLKDICRLHIRSSFKYPKLDKVLDEDIIPLSLVKYLKYEDD